MSLDFTINGLTLRICEYYMGCSVGQKLREFLSGHLEAEKITVRPSKISVSASKCVLTPQARETIARRFGILDIERSLITLVRFRILDLQAKQGGSAEVTVTCQCDEDDPTMLNINFVLNTGSFIFTIENCQFAGQHEGAEMNSQRLADTVMKAVATDLGGLEVIPRTSMLCFQLTKRHREELHRRLEQVCLVLRSARGSVLFCVFVAACVAVAISGGLFICLGQAMTDSFQ